MDTVPPLATATIWSAVVGIILLGAIICIAIFIPDPMPFPLLVFRVCLALGASAIASIMQGGIEGEVSLRALTIRSTGSLVLFLVVFFANPARLATAGAPAHKELRLSSRIVLSLLVPSVLLAALMPFLIAYGMPRPRPGPSPSTNSSSPPPSPQSIEQLETLLGGHGDQAREAYSKLNAELSGATTNGRKERIRLIIAKRMAVLDDVATEIFNDYRSGLRIDTKECRVQLESICKYYPSAPPDSARGKQIEAMLDNLWKPPTSKPHFVDAATEGVCTRGFIVKVLHTKIPGDGVAAQALSEIAERVSR